MGRVRNVEEGIKFKDNDYGICEVLKYQKTNDKSRSDIWEIRHEDGSKSMMCDWAIMLREQVS